LRCYYDEVHPFLAMLPTRQNFDAVLSTLLPESPLLLAVRTILVLVPHSQDPNPKSPTSKRLRTAMSAVLGKQTMDLIEATLENPSLETVQALCILSLWEWANSGNLARSRARSGQAIQVAMELGVHEMDKYSPGERAMEGEDWRMDMARRTWWTVYVAQLVSAFVSGTSPVIGPDDSRIHVLFPVCSLDDNSWPNWVKTNRQCVRVFGIVNAVYYSELAGLANAWGPRPHAMSAEAKAEMRQQVVDVDRQIQESMKQAEATSIIEFVPGGEEEVVRNQQTSTRLGLATLHIHIHRQQAFPEVSLFSKKICGLPQSKDFSPSMPMLDSVAVPQALADGNVPVYRESSAEKGYDREVDMKGPGHGQGNGDEYDDEADLGNLDFIGDMWQPDTYPENLPAPWFTHADGAASLWTSNELSPMHYPTISAWIAPTDSPSSRRPSVISSSSVKPHKAWGVDTNDKPTSPSPSSDDLVIFPPGISLARCATAAHTIVRLEVLHRSASIAMANGP